MEKKVWLSSVGESLEVTKTEPVSIGLNVSVAVRPCGSDIPFDGVWLNGERSYDTHVLIDGQPKYHTPVEADADPSFDLHEAAGGGELL